MESKGEVYISPKYSRDDYHQLKLKENSDESIWKKATEIFADRIYGRYINQIDLLCADINANGFTIMALNCLLVEAFYQFENGLKETEPKLNKDKYSGFLKKMAPSCFNNGSIAENFYTQIRCGILHSAQTKEESRLSDREGFVAIVENGVLVVSVKGVSDLVKVYLNNYVTRLLDTNELELRRNFIKKMNFVCRK